MSSTGEPSWAVIAALVCVPAALIGLSCYELWSAGMLAFGDLTAYPGDGGRFVDSFLSAWSHRGLGGPFAAPHSALITALLIATTGGHGEVAQYLHLAAWIPVAFATMVYLCRRWLHVTWGVAIAGGVIYVTTPVAIGLVVAGAGGLFWAYALAPAVIATAEKVRAEGFRALGWFAAMLALLSAFSADVLVLGFVVAAIWVVIGRGRRRVLAAMAVALVLATTAALPGLVARGEIRPSDRLTEKALTDFEYTYDKTSLATLLRLAGNQGDPMDPLGYNETTAWTLVGFAPCILLVAGLLPTRTGNGLPLRLGVLTAAAILALLGLAFAAERRLDLLERLPPLLAFRNPEKLMILLASALVAGGTYGAHRVIISAGRGRRLVGFTALATLGVYLAVYARPAFSGHWGVKSVRGKSYVADETLLAAARYLRQTDPNLLGKWRIAWVPFSSTDVLSLEWVLPEWANEPVLENRDPEIEDTSEVVEDSLYVGDMQVFHTVADRAAVRYIVLRKDAGPITVRAIQNDRNMERIHRGRGFEVWRNAAALPRIRSFSALTAVLAPRRPHPVEFASHPILRFSRDALGPRSRWRVHPREDFAWVGRAVRIRATGPSFWPVLARRLHVYGDRSYEISAWARTRDADSAHLKVIWYRRRTDPERKALGQDYADPILTGDHGWTRVSGVVESPSDAKFAEVAFLAGKRQGEGGDIAVSWVRDLRIAPHYRGDPAQSGVDLLAEAPELVRPNRELVDANALERLSSGIPAQMNIDAIVLNPRIEQPRAKKSWALLRRADQITIVGQAEVGLRPRRGVWSNTYGSAQVVSAGGEAVLPLGRVESREYYVSVVGCRIASDSMRIRMPGRSLRPRLSGPTLSCGRMRTMEPVALKGRVMVELTLARGASIERVEAITAADRQPAARGRRDDVRVTAADSSSPAIRNLSAAGITLADAFHPGWRASGTKATHFRTLMGFNGFLLDEPQALTDLTYDPQRMRDLLLFLSAVSWVAIIGLIVFAPHRTRVRLRNRSAR